jgi:hypothetical protein
MITRSYLRVEQIERAQTLFRNLLKLFSLLELELELELELDKGGKVEKWLQKCVTLCSIN